MSLNYKIGESSKDIYHMEMSTPTITCFDFKKYLVKTYNPGVTRGEFDYIVKNEHGHVINENDSITKGSTVIVSRTTTGNLLYRLKHDKIISNHTQEKTNSLPKYVYDDANEIECRYCFLNTHKSKDCPMKEDIKLQKILRDINPKVSRGIPLKDLLPIRDFYDFIKTAMSQYVILKSPNGGLVYKREKFQIKNNGNENDYLNILNNLMKCSICNGICKEANHLDCCHNNVCKKCIQNALEKSDLCPLCSKRINVNSYSNNISLNNAISELEALKYKEPNIIDVNNSNKQQLDQKIVNANPMIQASTEAVPQVSTVPVSVETKNAFPIFCNDLKSNDIKKKSDAINLCIEYLIDSNNPIAYKQTVQSKLNELGYSQAIIQQLCLAKQKTIQPMKTYTSLSSTSTIQQSNSKRIIASNQDSKRRYT